MREIKVAALEPSVGSHGTVLHKSGVELLAPKEILSTAVIAALREAGVESVFMLDREEELADVRRILTYTSTPLDSIVSGVRLPMPLCGKNGERLLEADTPVPKDFVHSLRERGIDRVYSPRSKGELHPDEGLQLRLRIEEVAGERASRPGRSTTIRQLDEIELAEASEDELNEESLRAKIDEMADFEIRPTGEPLLASVCDTRKLGPADKHTKAVFTSTIDECLNAMKEMYATLADDPGKGRFDLPQIESVATRVISGLIEHRELLMLCGAHRNSDEYRSLHALAMTVVAVNIGTSMKYDAAQIKALAYGAMLADVGMLLVPPEILEKPGKLTAREYAEIKRHPAFGLDILHRIRHIPTEVPYVVYQSHERPNGSGYPCGKRNVVIHPFAKIVTIADIYTSICAQRPYRSEKLPYEAMEQILLMCGKQFLDPDIVRAFLSCNSLFPIGSCVRLSDGRAGRVVAANPEDFMRPIVAILEAADGNVLHGEDREDLLVRQDLSVKQALRDRDLGIESESLIGF